MDQSIHTVPACLSTYFTHRPVGETNDITTIEQVSNRKAFGHAKDKIIKQLVPGGHVDLFTSSRNSKEVCRPDCRPLSAQRCEIGTEPT